MINTQLLSILKKYIGDYSELKNGDYEFYCSICNHHKKKLIVNLDDASPNFGHWHCWVCNNGSKSLPSLFSKSKKSVSEPDKEILRTIFKGRRIVEQSSEKTIHSIFLPQEYKSLLIPDLNNPEYKNAIHYAKQKRGLTDYDIKRYKIGYCAEGKYSGRLIIPSHDINNQLNYFQARVYYTDSDCKKFDNPPTDYNSIIGFENYINWNEPLVLCEGAMDAIAIRHNAIPCFGKNISSLLIKKIYEKSVKTIYLFLDQDAIYNVIKTAEKFFYQGIEIFIINYNSEKDAADMGYEECQRHIRNATRITEPLLMKLKINNTQIK